MTTAKRLLVVASILVAVDVVLELAGGRAATGALSGSVHAPGTLLFGLVTVVAWFAAILVAPPLVLTAAVLAALRALGAGGSAETRLR